MRYVFILITLCVVKFSLHAQVVINEISSRGNIVDESGETVDWIEVYNKGSEPVNLFNYGLTDDATNLFLWKFPNITVAPGEYVVVLADGEGAINSTNHYETAVFHDDTWKYFIGSAEPPAGWKNISFDDADWNSGVGGIGYGDADDGTLITSTTSVYLRKIFSITDTAAISNAILHVDYDDAFVAYLNGVEIARSANITGSPPAYTDVATFDHEASFYLGSLPEAYTISDAVLQDIMLEGDNVLSLQVHNTSLFSSDLSSNAWLTFGIKTSDTFFASLPSWFILSSTYNHTNFSLNTNGETIYLTDTLGNIIDQKYYAYLENTHSLARKPDGEASWCMTNETSPGLSNNSAACFDGFETEPVFSLLPGFYSGPQTIEISTASSTAVIRYTLDGSHVRETSPVYTSPITIDTTSVISAKCFSAAGKLPSQIRKKTYFIDEDETDLPVISISADPGSFFDIDSGIYVFGPEDWYPSYPYYGANFWEPWKRLAHIAYFDESGTEQFAKQINIEIHGGWSRAENQRSFTIDFKNELDGSLSYQLYPDDKPEVTEINNFNLRNGGQHVWGTRIQDAFIARAMNKTHLDYEAYHPCIVYINGNYWGIYEIREKADEYYVESNYAIDADDVDLRNGWSVLSGSDTSFTNLYNWVMSNNPADAGFYDGFAQRVDIENYVDYFIAEIYCQNVDWGGTYWELNNIKLWQTNTAEGKIRHIMYDMDGALGWFGDNVYTNYINLARLPNYPNFSSEIFDRVLENEQFRNYFINRFADIINTVFQMDILEPLQEDMENEIEDDMERHIERWYLPSSYAYWKNTMNAMINYLEDRIAPARTQIRTSFSLTAERNVELDVYPEGAGYIHISTIFPGPLPWSGVYFDDVPVKISAIANPGYTFTDWSPNGIIPSGSDEQSLEVYLSSSETFTANFTGTAVTPDIIVTEVNYNSAGSMNAGDWIELYNADATDYDLSGWRLYDENEVNYFVFPLGTKLESNTYIVIAENPTSFAAVYPDLPQPLGPLPYTLSNSGDKLLLKTAQDEIVFDFAYLDSLGWPKGADGTGRTLEILDYTFSMNDPLNWFDGCIFGSPGIAYSDCTSEIVFGEINYNSAAAMDAGDWVELYNTSTTAIDISGWKFADNRDSALYYFPSATILDASERLVLANDLTAFTDRHPSVSNYMGPFPFGLKADGEEIRILDEQGRVQFSMIYNNVFPWPVEADGGGKTLELLSPIGKMNDAANWFAGCPEGSPSIAYDPDCVSLVQDISTFDVLVYPNPAVAEFYLVLNMPQSLLINTAIQITDASGKVVKQIFSPHTTVMAIQRDQLTAGVYYIEIVTDTESLAEKIVLQ